MTSNAGAAHNAARPALLFVAACLWIAVSVMAGSLLAGVAPAAYADLVQQSVTAALLFGGFYLMARAAVPGLRPMSSVGFVRRPGSERELGLGLALGWGIAIALLLPALFTRNLHMGLSLDAPSLLAACRSAVTLALFALNVQLVLAGLPARLLLRLVGPGIMSLASVFFATLLVFVQRAQPGRNLLFTALAAALFSTAFQRTRAAWMPLGVQLGWTLSLGLLFGISSPYTPLASGFVLGRSGGSPAFTGGALGPEASAFAVLVLVAALLVLRRITRDYAWHYTYQPIVSAGYAMDVAPPPEHVREENRAAAAAPLVQIGGIVGPPSVPIPSDTMP